MIEQQQKTVARFTEQDLQPAGISIARLSQEVGVIGQAVMEGYVTYNKAILAFPTTPTALRFIGLYNRQKEQIELLSEYGNEQSVFGKVENEIVPFGHGLVGGETDKEDESKFDDCLELWDLDGAERSMYYMDDLSPHLQTALRVGTMLVMHDTTDEMLELTKLTGNPSNYARYQQNILLFRSSDVMARVGTLSLVDLSSATRRGRLTLADQYRLLIGLTAGQEVDVHPPDPFRNFPTLAKVALKSAANIAHLLIDCPTGQLQEEVIGAGFTQDHLHDVASRRFLAVAQHVSRLRDFTVKELSSYPTDDFAQVILNDLDANSPVRDAALHFLRLDQPEVIWAVYQQVAGKDDRLAEVAREQARKIPERPFLTDQEIPDIYDKKLPAGKNETVTIEHLQKTARTTPFYSCYEFTFQSTDLIFSKIDYGQIKLPDGIKVVFDRHNPSRKFNIKFGYNHPEKGALVFNLDFDLQKGGLINWNMMDAPTQPRMQELLQASLGATGSILEVIRSQRIAFAEEKQRLKAAASVVAQPTLPKKGEYIPVPKSPDLQAKHVHNGNGKASEVVINHTDVMGEDQSVDQQEGGDPRTHIKWFPVYGRNELVRCLTRLGFVIDESKGKGAHAKAIHPTRQAVNEQAPYVIVRRLKEYKDPNFRSQIVKEILSFGFSKEEIIDSLMG